uniref:Uncharacterized protein n=1 Tax=viral metagenome TaxID=1070528 RepID=A0A6H1ZQ34_9ZZZZ
MANEFKHASVGTELAQAEWESTTGHVFDSQATGDLLYASSAAQLSRLAAGTQGYPLVMGASVPQWGGAITLNGTVTLNGQTFSGTAKFSAGINTFGATPLGYIGNHFYSTFTSDGGANLVAGSAFSGAIAGASGDIASIVGVRIAHSLYTQTAAESIAYVAQLGLVEPAITNNLTGGGVITVAATLYVVSAPTEGATNAAIYVASGDTNISTLTTRGATTLGGTVNINGQQFNAGAGEVIINTTGSAAGLQLWSTCDGQEGALFRGYHNSTSPAVDDIPLLIWSYGKNSVAGWIAYSKIHTVCTNVTSTTEAAKLEFRLMDAGAENLAMWLSGAGGLSVDADIGTADDPVALFDSIPAKYGIDDAQFLAKYAIGNMMPALCDIGVMSRKDTGSGYMLSMQKAHYLSWGAIKALYERIEQLEAELALRRN